MPSLRIGAIMKFFFESISRRYRDCMFIFGQKPYTGYCSLSHNSQRILLLGCNAMSVVDLRKFLPSYQSSSRRYGSIFLAHHQGYDYSFFKVYVSTNPHGFNRRLLQHIFCRAAMVLFVAFFNSFCQSLTAIMDDFLKNKF